MFKEIKILAIVHLDAFGETYKERTLNVEMPDQWSTIDKPANLIPRVVGDKPRFHSNR